MVIIRKTLKNGKISITSSCFEDIRTYRMSLSESKKDDYVSAKWRRNAGRDFSGIEFETTKQVLLLAKKGCNEISEYVKQIKEKDLPNYKINWGPCETYISYDDLCKSRDELEAKRASGEEFTADDIAELDRVKKEIDNIDRFVDTQIQRIEAEEIA